MIKKAEDMRTLLREGLRGGDGTVDTLYLLEKEDMRGKCDLFAILTLEPGCSIGLHDHNPDAELFYLLEGELVTADNGVPGVLRAGDVMFTGFGETHFLRNETEKTARVLAVIVP